MPIQNFYSISPSDLKPGDVLVATVTLHVSHFRGNDGKPRFRMYRCDFTNPQLDEDGVPQGSRINGEGAVAEALFPVAIDAGMLPEA